MAKRDRILIVEDEGPLRQSLTDLFEQDGFEVDAVADLARAQEILGRSPPAVVLLDLSLPDGSGIDLLQSLPGDPTDPAVVVLTGDRAIDTAVSAVRMGAHDYLAKPFSVTVLRHRIDKALEYRSARLLRVAQQRQGSLDQLGAGIIELPSPSMREVYTTVRRVAEREITPVLVTGETGVGKESICRALHVTAPRADEPFIVVNCAELDRQLLRSELFGHERGAFTGATERRVGLFELATRGTLMLDEVAELTPEVQALFLRVLEDGWFRRLGSTREVRTEARIIAATNQPLETLVERGHFRSDLLYRLNSVEIRVPPLRERPDDIVALARHFVARRSRSTNRAELTPQALDRLVEHSWPGNVRELRSVIDRTLLAKDGPLIDAHDLEVRPVVTDAPSPAGPKNLPSRPRTLSEVERLHIDRVLAEVEGNRTRAAEVLGIARSTLARKLTKSN